GRARPCVVTAFAQQHAQIPTRMRERDRDAEARAEREADVHVGPFIEAAGIAGAQRGEARGDLGVERLPGGERVVARARRDAARLIVLLHAARTENEDAAAEKSAPQRTRPLRSVAHA